MCRTVSGMAMLQLGRWGIGHPPEVLASWTPKDSDCGSAIGGGGHVPCQACQCRGWMELLPCSGSERWIESRCVRGIVLMAPRQVLGLTRSLIGYRMGYRGEGGVSGRWVRQDLDEVWCVPVLVGVWLCSVVAGTH